MAPRNNRQAGVRVRIAAAAARIMAEDGIDDYALAKRKAARQVGASARDGLPTNEEIEAELRAYRALYQADEHPGRIAELRAIALDAMLLFERFTPYLTGPVLEGNAGPYAAIELQLFPESAKELQQISANPPVRRLPTLAPKLCAASSTTNSSCSAAILLIAL